MSYSKEIKLLMSQYFKWYRIVTNKSLSEISYKINCDYRTYRDIEKGIIKKDNSYYNKLINYLKIQFYSNYEPLYECYDLIEPLYDAIEKYNYEIVNSILIDMKNKISSLSNYIFYKELFLTIEIIEKHYINNLYLSIEEIYQAIKYSKLWNNKLSSILIEACEKSNLNIHYNLDVSNELYKDICMQDAISKYWYARECVMHVNYAEALDLYKELINYYDNIGNYERKLNVMLNEFAVYRDIDIKKANEYMLLLEKESEKKYFTNKSKKNLNYTIAIFYYFQNNYKKALYYFKESYQYGIRDVCLIFIYACESRLNQLEKITHNFNSSHPLYNYIEYFEKKADKCESRILEEHIFEKIIPILMSDKYEEPFWSMFGFEINQLVENTKRYKKLKKFNDFMSQSTKSTT